MAFSAKSYPSREQRHFPNRFRRQTGQTRRPPRPLGSPWQHRPASGMKDLSRWTKDTFDRSVPSNTRVSERGTNIDHCDCAPRHLPRHLPRHTTLLNKEQNHDDDDVYVMQNSFVISRASIYSLCIAWMDQHPHSRANARSWMVAVVLIQEHTFVIFLMLCYVRIM